MTYFNPNQNYNAGFSLVETLVAIAILLIVIVGPMSIATNSANSTSFANQQVMAYFLAQEGLELAQKGRDDLLLANFNSGNVNQAWNLFTNSGGLYADCFQNAGCGLEIEEGAVGSIDVINCSDAVDCRLYLSDDRDERSQYTYDTSSQITDFTRIITMVASGDEVQITSTVSWRTGNQIALQTTTATTYLYNIYGR